MMREWSINLKVVFWGLHTTLQMPPTRRNSNQTLVFLAHASVESVFLKDRGPNYLLMFRPDEMLVQMWTINKCNKASIIIFALDKKQMKHAIAHPLFIQC